MDIKEARDNILESDDFVVEEAKKLQTLYALKTEIRYGHERTSEAHTESVAEHIYALHSLVDYFLPLEDLNNNLDRLKVHDMIQYHDIGEIITGDIVAYHKTAADYEAEADAAKEVIVRLPSTMQERIDNLIDEFETQASVESKLVRAIDKFEPLIHCFNDTGKATLQANKFTLAKRLDYASDALISFPIMSRFESVLDDLFVKEGYYFQE